MGSPSYAPSARTVVMGPLLCSSTGPTCEASPASVVVSTAPTMVEEVASTHRCSLRHVQFAPRPRSASAMLVGQPFARAVDLQATLLHRGDFGRRKPFAGILITRR